MSGLVILASYPKSGNTWLRAVITSVLGGGAAIDINKLYIRNWADRQLYARLLGVSVADLGLERFAALRGKALEYAAQQTHPARSMFLKVHDAWLPSGRSLDMPIPEQLISAVVYLVRDPRDVALSFARHRGISLEAAIQAMGSPGFQLGYRPRGLRRQVPQLLSTWGVHVCSWLDGFRGPLLTVRYEDMLAAPHETFAGALRFLGLRITPEVLNRALAATTFSELGRQESEHGFIERPVTSTRFFHSGAANKWRDSLTCEQVRRINDEHGSVMRRLGYSSGNRE
jgi:aryl sulfotransferase